MSLKARYMLYLVMWLAINFFSVAMSVPAFAGQIIYVDGDASRANNGTSWADAYNYLQDALASATYGDEVRVAQGMYTPDHGVGLTLGNRRATFSLKNGVAVRGGFAGFGEPDPNSRDIERYKTILSGDLAGNDVDVIDPCDLRLFHLPPTRIDNSYTLLTSRNTDQTTILDGFTISAGCWAGETFPGTGIGAGMHNSASSPTLLDCTFTGNICSGYGSGGMHNINDSNPTLVRCTFEKNYGCAMGNLGGDPKLIDCKFIDNFSLSNGGAMYNGGSNPTLTRCLFSDNLGGAMHNRKSSPMLDKCTFIRNSVSTRGGAIFNTDSSPTLVDCVFTENTASYYAGAVYSDGGQLTVKGCVFVKNYPGAIYNYSKTGSVFTNCTFSGNSGLGWGGAIHTYNSTFINCVFAGNRALGYRLNDGIWLPSKGGAVYYFSSYSYSMIFTNCTFSNNWADSGNSIYCYGLAYLNNCILWGSGEQIALDDPQWPQMVTMRYSDVQGGWPGVGNIDTDPCFADPGYWDPNGTPEDPNDDFWIDGDYHLKSQAERWEPETQSWVKDDVTSSCIDAGDPMSPIGHEPFPNGGIINIGAYGGTAEASKSFLSEPGCEMTESGFVGDIDGVIGVSFGDFALLANYWLDTGAGLIADITDDNDVDYGDLQPLAGNWLCGCDQIQSFSAYPYSVYFGCNPVIADATINSFDPKTVSYFWEYIDELEDTGTIEMAEPNELQNCDEPESCRVIYLTDTEKKRIHAAKTAHSIWLDKNDILAWNIRMYSEDELAGLFDEALVFSRSGSRDYFFSVVDHSPSEVYDYLAGSELLRDDIFSTFYAVLDDLRSDFRHGNTGDGNRNSAYTVREALTTYAANDRRVSRAGCHSMTRIAIALLRSVNIPGEETTSGKWFEAGHSSAVWPTLGYVLPHGDNIYNAFLRATPVDEFLPTLTFYQANLGTKPCEASLVCLSHRHMSLNAIRYPPAWMLDRCCDPTRYGYDDCRDYIYDTHSSYLTAEEMDAAATELEGLCGTR